MGYVPEAVRVAHGKYNREYRVYAVCDIKRMVRSHRNPALGR